MQRRFRQVDVFTKTPYFGNPLAVVVDGDGLSDEQMQRFANWTNLSETTFLCPPTDPSADYRVRIFTNGRELPFAGHPTLGTAHVWRETGGSPKRENMIVQECGVGLVEIAVDADLLSFAAPPLMRADAPTSDELAAAVDALGIADGDIVDAQWVVNGPQWLAIQLGSAQAVLAVRPRACDLDLGVVGFYADSSGPLYEVRAFFPVNGQSAEDPVTGSLNAGVAQWLIGSGRATPPYVATQGTALGRKGRVHVDRTADGRIWIGGQVASSINGTVEL